MLHLLLLHIVLFILSGENPCSFDTGQQEEVPVCESHIKIHDTYAMVPYFEWVVNSHIKQRLHTIFKIKKHEERWVAARSYHFVYIAAASMRQDSPTSNDQFILELEYLSVRPKLDTLLKILCGICTALEYMGSNNALKPFFHYLV